MAINFYNTTKNLTNATNAVIEVFDYVYETDDNAVYQEGVNNKIAEGRVVEVTSTTLTKIYVSSGTWTTSKNMFNQDGDYVNVSAVNAGTVIPANHVHVSGDNSASTDIFEDIRAASSGGGWGIDSATNKYETKLDCQIWFGGREQTAATIVKSESERVWITGGTYCLVLTGKSGATTTFYQGTGTYKGTCKNGTYIRSDGFIRSDTNCLYYFYAGWVEAPTLKLGGMELNGTDYLCSEGRILNACYPATSAGTYIDKFIVIGGYGWVPYATPAEVTAITVRDTDYGIFAPVALTATIRNSTFSNVSFALGAMAVTALYAIDCTADLTTASRVMGGKLEIFAQASINLKYVDEANNNISGVTSKLVNSSGTQQFSVISAADGTITEQIVTYYYKRLANDANGGNTTTDYNDFTLTSSKSGYKTVKTKFTIGTNTTQTMPVKWTITLKKNRFREEKSIPN